ncbi:protein DEFECTIVE IN MERISTEM SILENCING 3-like isoform X2 [Apium graveolens]|uniref:protein DEFECTIVE IN MERISTEM SILENCING 3-like isoform X2 n=1 Tax=Apium graveolens TaxID=4045 RepID=UPI003D7AEF18
MTNHSNEQIYAQNSSPALLVDQGWHDITVKSEPESETLSQAERALKKLQEALEKKGRILKKHEENIKFLTRQENTLNDTILDLQVTLGKYHSSNRPMMERGNLSQEESEVENIQRNLKHTNSAAGVVCQLKTRHSTRGSQFPLTKGILGIVATLGKVDDDTINSYLSSYLGKTNMLAVVCKTLDTVKAMESYDKEGLVKKNSGIHGLGASIGQTIDGRFCVICLECLSPYVGGFITNDPQRRLDIQKPRLPNGEIPHGFIDYAVNMIYIDRENLFYVTHDGYGLRETLFYHLFSRVQVYQTRKDMMQAVSLITDGAISLDGEIIKSPGDYIFGAVEEADVKFLKASGPPCPTADYSAIEDKIKKTEWEKERISDDLRREQVLLKQAKVTFNAKREELIQFLAQSSNTVQSPAARDGSALRFQIKSEVKNETSSGN